MVFYQTTTVSRNLQIVNLDGNIYEMACDVYEYSINSAWRHKPVMVFRIANIHCCVNSLIRLTTKRTSKHNITGILWV